MELLPSDCVWTYLYRLKMQSVKQATSYEVSQETHNNSNRRIRGATNTCDLDDPEDGNDPAEVKCLQLPTSQK